MSENETAADAAKPGSEGSPKRRKKRRKKRASKGRAKPEEASPKNTGRGWWLWIGLLLVGVVELWLFGRRGHIEVCVAKDGVHDFALLGQPRTDETSRRFPTCERRFNLGVIGAHDETREEALLHACHRANILVGTRSAAICAIEEDGWKHRVVEEQCMPWHDHFYKRLLWFAF